MLVGSPFPQRQPLRYLVGVLGVSIYEVGNCHSNDNASHKVWPAAQEAADSTEDILHCNFIIALRLRLVLIDLI